MNQDSPYLPEEGIIFIDNCVFNGKENTYNHKNIDYHKRINFFRSDTKYHKIFRRILLKRNNWLTIPEVIEEFEDGIKGLEGFIKSINSCMGYYKRFRKFKSKNSFEDYDNAKGLKKTLGLLIKEKKRLDKMLHQDFVDATQNMTLEMQCKFKELYPIVRNTFLSKGGEPHKRDTDCKLITTALVYSEDSQVYLMSFDRILLKTFSEAIEKITDFPEPNFIIRNSQVLTTKEYLNIHNKVLVH